MLPVSSDARLEIISVAGSILGLSRIRLIRRNTS